MSFNFYKEFSSMMNTIESELSTERLPGAYTWMDKNKNNAFSKCVDRLSSAIEECRDSGDKEKWCDEIEIYKSRMVVLLREYKLSVNLGETASFLESLRGLNDRK